VDKNERILKALERYRAHFPARHFEGMTDADDNFVYYLNEIESIRKVRGGAVKVSYFTSSEWYYYGTCIELNEDVPSGCTGRWTVGGYRNGR